MSRSNRHKRRPLGFEDLEGKASPTSLVAFAADGGSIDKVAIISSAGTDDSAQRALQAERFLSFVSSMENVSLEGALPTQAEADAVDAWIVRNLPPSAT